MRRIMGHKLALLANFDTFTEMLLCVSIPVKQTNMNI